MAVIENLEAALTSQWSDGIITPNRPWERLSG